VAGNLVQVAATGDVATGPRQLHSVVLTAAAAAASVVVRDGSGGAVRLTVKAAIEATVSWVASDPKGVPFYSSVHATLTGAGALVSVEYS